MKILEIQELAEKLKELKSKGKKLVHCHGCFDLMHPGHIRHFQAAKKLGDILAATITPDVYVDKGSGRPVFNQDLRADAVAALECVDYVAINKWPTAEETIRRLQPDIYVKGQEFERLEDKTGKLQREHEVLKETGAELRFTHDIVFSSTKLLNEHYLYPAEIKQFLAEFSRKYSFKSITEMLDGVKSLKVLLVGDGIIDEYHYCESMGKSPKAQLVVNKHLGYEVFAGGAFAIANHLASMCDSVQLVSLLGKDDTKEDFILNHLKENVEARFFYRDDGPTVVKKRYINQYQNQKMFEVNYINDEFINSECELDVLDYVKRKIPEFDLTLISDFGHGFITDKMIKCVETLSRKLAINSQTNGANVGYNLVTKYKSADFVCLDVPEARLAVQDKYSEIEDVGKKVLKRLSTNNLIITLGSKGSIGFSKDGEVSNIPALSSNVIDIVGAGDAFFAYAALCLALEMPLDLVSFIGNAAGALAIQITANERPVEKDELLRFIRVVLE